MHGFSIAFDSLLRLAVSAQILLGAIIGYMVGAIILRCSNIASGRCSERARARIWVLPGLDEAGLHPSASELSP
jgi:hypothetical protein